MLRIKPQKSKSIVTRGALKFANLQCGMLVDGMIKRSVEVGLYHENYSCHQLQNYLSALESIMGSTLIPFAKVTPYWGTDDKPGVTSTQSSLSLACTNSLTHIDFSFTSLWYYKRRC